MKRTIDAWFFSKNLAVIEFAVFVLSLFTCIKSSDAGPQTAVYVRFLSPPHGYTHGLEVHYPGAVPVAKEERLYLPLTNQQNQHQNHHQYSNQNNRETQVNMHHHHQNQQPQQQNYDSGTPDYQYPRPHRVFHELGERFMNSMFSHGRALPELLYPTGLFQGPSSAAEFKKEHPGPTFDPMLLTGSFAQRIVSMVLAHGILYFHEIPHEPLVLGNNLERINNNLIPHRLGSIRPGHPFFNFNK